MTDNYREILQQAALDETTFVQMTFKGEISNISNSTQKIPWLRFALNDGRPAEVYTWTLDTGARPLRAGESTMTDHGMRPMRPPGMRGSKRSLSTRSPRTWR